MFLTGIIEQILIHLIIPEVASIIRRKPDATDAEVIAELALRHERIRDKGLAFLARTAPSEPPAVG